MSAIASTVNTVVRGATEERALKLLGSGCGPEVVATAVGVSVSRISQLLSEPEFAAAVSELRFQNLQKHNEMDSKYDTMEKKLVDQLEDLLPLMMRPMEILKAIQVINGAKRRGQSAPESITHQNTVVNLVMPTTLIQKFTTNINNQVINAGNQTLETMQSSQMLVASKAREMERLEGVVRNEHISALANGTGGNQGR
jgi:hypothetical protein